MKNRFIKLILGKEFSKSYKAGFEDCSLMYCKYIKEEILPVLKASQKHTQHLWDKEIFPDDLYNRITNLIKDIED